MHSTRNLPKTKQKSKPLTNLKSHHTASKAPLLTTHACHVTTSTTSTTSTISTTPLKTNLKRKLRPTTTTTTQNTPLNLSIVQQSNLSTLAPLRNQLSPTANVKHSKIIGNRRAFSTEISAVEPEGHQLKIKKDHLQPLSSQLGDDVYNFNAVTELSSSYNPDPTRANTQQGKFEPEKISDGADAYDILAALRNIQKTELETQLNGVVDDNERSYIIYQSASTFQQRLARMKNVRRNKKTAVINHVHNALRQIKSISTHLSLLDTISLLRSASLGEPQLQLYNLGHISSLHDYMLFYSCRDQTHLTLIANAVVEFISTHQRFNNSEKKNHDNNDSTQSSDSLQMVKQTSKRSKTLQNIKDGEDNEIIDENDPKYSGRKVGQVLIFSPNELPWRVLDLGPVLLHLSYGPERRMTDMESILNGYEINLMEKTTQQTLSTIKLHKCLEITPISQLEEDAEINNTPSIENTPIMTPPAKPQH